MNFTTGETTSDLLSLDRIRSTLNRLEDTIIFHLIERAQFAHNPITYQPGGFAELKEKEFDGSWLEWFLKEIETFHAKARRYTSPDEHPFTPLGLLPLPVLQPQSNVPSLLHPHSINANSQIKDFYVKEVVPAITKNVGGGMEDDGNYGSSATRDVEVLQAISRRVHFGMFVAESKFISSPSSFLPHILTPNGPALLALITKPAVEAALLVRLANKARLYGQDLDAMGNPIHPEGEGGDESGRGKIEAEEVVKLYERYIIPLTKEVEVDYLYKRLDGVSQEQIDRWMAEGSASSS